MTLHMAKLAAAEVRKVYPQFSIRIVGSGDSHAVKVNDGEELVLKFDGSQAL